MLIYKKSEHRQGEKRKIVGNIRGDMKNKLSLILAVTILAIVVLGCSSINPFADKSTPANTRANANKTLTDKAVDTAVAEEKIGVPECDEVMDMLTAYGNNPDDNFIVKAGKAMIVNKIRESIRTSVEQNKGDKVELAKNCREFKRELEKYKAEEDAKKGQ